MKFIQTILLPISILFFISSASAQTWKELKNNPSINIYEVVEAAELHFKDIDKAAKGSGWKGYQRWLFENEAKYYPSGDREYRPIFCFEKF